MMRRMTFYLDDDAQNILIKIYTQRLKRHEKVTRSSIIVEALNLLVDQEEKESLKAKNPE